MKIATFVSVFAGLMLLMTLGGAVLAIWTADRADFFGKRINLANNSYQKHLELSSNTYQLFKQFGDAMIVGDRDKGEGEKELIQLIRNNIRDIRTIIGEEIELVGDEEIEELETLSIIERKIDGLILKYIALAKNHSSATINTDWIALSAVLDNDVDLKFRAMIGSALEEERAELDETRAEALAQTVFASRLAYGFGLAAILVTLIAVLLYRRDVTRPFNRLMTGVEAFRSGHFDKSISLKGMNEISEIAVVLDEMASKVQARTLTLTEQNAELERAVEARTNELERLLGEAQDSEAHRRQMLADVSHELRTPLTIIQGESDIALRGGDKPPEQYREALTRTRDAAAHTARLVNDLLFISRKEAGEARLILEEFDVQDLIVETVGMSQLNASITSDTDRAQVTADSVRLRQAILALLHNAQNHGGSEVGVRLTATPKGYRISIEDNGPGLSDAEKDKAFERFFRGSNASASYDSGAGLGLPIVRSIAEAHGGSAWLGDREGGGTVAVIELPNRPTLRAVS
ncbi:MAG: ATP-binding protein [Hyphomicrobiaceae bacterium]